MDGHRIKNIGFFYYRRRTLAHLSTDLITIKNMGRQVANKEVVVKCCFLKFENEKNATY